MKVRPYQNLYIHVPFCNGKCAYCAFYSEPEVKQEAVDAWLCRLELDAKQYAPQSVPLNTVYLGGGTPTAIPPESLERLDNDTLVPISQCGRGVKSKTVGSKKVRTTWFSESSLPTGIPGLGMLGSASRK